MVKCRKFRSFSMTVWILLVLLMRIAPGRAANAPAASPDLSPGFSVDDCTKADGESRARCEGRQRKGKSSRPRHGDRPGTIAPSRTPGKPILDDRAHYFADAESESR